MSIRSAAKKKEKMLEQQFRNNSPAAAGFPFGKGMAAPASILIVDDDAGMRTALLKILRTNGFHCFSAEHGAAMFDVLERHEVDLILLDVMLPGANGFDLCRDLRLRDGSSVPIIMISARGEEADLVTGSSSARTITSPSPSARTSFSRGSAPPSAGLTPRRSLPPGRRAGWNSPAGRWICGSASCSARRVREWIFRAPNTIC